MAELLATETGNSAGTPRFLRRLSERITVRQNREMVFQETFTLSFSNNSLMVSNDAPLWRRFRISSLYRINSRNSFEAGSNASAASRNDCFFGWLLSIPG